MTSVSRKPFYSSITIIVFLPLAVILIYGIVIFSFGMRILEENQIDSIVHGCGGMSAYLSSAGVLWHLVRREIIIFQDENVFRFLAFGLLCFIVIGWEIFEYIVFHPSEYLNYTDTIIDMAFGLIGGLFAMLFFRKPVLSENSS